MKKRTQQPPPVNISPHHVRSWSALLSLLLGALSLSACDSEVSPPTMSEGGVMTSELDAFVLPPEELDAEPTLLYDALVLGRFGEPCERGLDCASGYCIDTGLGGKVCTQNCAGDCPEGFECISTGSAPDILLLCAPDQHELCKACESDDDCDDPEDLCVQVGLRTYCGERCESDEGCPPEFSCVEVEREGEVSGQCVPRSGECAPCADQDGDGYGMGSDCLGFDCNEEDPLSYEGAGERCDGRDNDCDSLIDEALTDAPPAELSCAEEGVCAGVTPSCDVSAWACVYPEGYEDDELTCDTLDNDCDGAVDEAFDLMTDVEHCGACGEVCELDNATPRCREGVCEIERCEPGWYDVNAEHEDGCEYSCVTSAGGLEQCDQIDNDCDGRADEDFDFEGSLAHCGGCNQRCDLPQAEAACVVGACTFVSCDAQFYDINQDPTDGCEYGCALSNGGDEACDLLDNDCDGRADEDFDLNADLNNCGVCGRVCSLPNAVSACEEGACAFVGCAPGFVDLNGDPNDGCEYACTPERGVDLPDLQGIDLNCDGIDGDRSLAVFVSPSGNDNRTGLNTITAVRTLSRALEVAQSSGRAQIWVASGSYQESQPLQLMSGVGLYGGYNAQFTERDSSRASLTVSTPTAVEAFDLTAPTTLQRVDVQTADRAGVSEASLAILVSDAGAHLTLADLEVVAGRGSAGSAGTAGRPGVTGSRGTDASGASRGVGGNAGGGLGANGRYRAVGLPGSAGAANGSSCGGAAGAGSGSAGMGCDDGNPQPGGNGGAGCSGVRGGHGSPGSSTGAWSGLTWLPSHGQSGALGTTGGGGGGGGAGGGESCNLFLVTYYGTGRAGGGGGGGGSGGIGGTGGRGGGASIALVVERATVNLEDVTLRTRGGGDGGAGGAGGNGGNGGSGGFGATSNENTEGDGGNGGSGGRGGDGGCGGGGGGGPSVAIYGLGSAFVNRAGVVTLSPANGGQGGSSCGASGAQGVRAQSVGVTLN